jgi:very-short-patch-repair endonuclease
MTERPALEAALDLALSQDGVLSRTQARVCGMDRWAVGHQVGSRRWKAYGVHSIAVHRLPLDFRARCRVSVWEAGEHAALDGSTSLTWRGLKGWDDGIHVIVPWPGRAITWDGSVVHPSRLWNPADLRTHDGLRLTDVAVGTIRAAMWARSDRAAATVMAMSVQQRLATPDRVLLEARRLNRHKRRPLILDVARDIADGAQALSELDFARLCRRRNLPEPTRQKVRAGRHGRVYLDVEWDEWRVVVEVEGAHHDAPENAVDDALRQNALTIGRLGVLRIPVLGLRTCAGEFLDQVDQLLRQAGWRPTAA